MALILIILYIFVVAAHYIQWVAMTMNPYNLYSLPVYHPIWYCKASHPFRMFTLKGNDIFKASFILPVQLL